MSTQHDRLIQAGAPSLPDDFMYEVAITMRRGQYVVYVDVRHEVSGDLHASIDRTFACPAVSDLVDMAREAAGKAHPEDALSSAMRELVFGKK